MADVFVLVGPPGSGKGTQAKMLAPKLGVPHISLGDLLREAVRNKTKVGDLAKSYLDAGKLVPDKVVANVAEETMKKNECANGFVVDGFPRTLEQAGLFEGTLKRLGFSIKKVIFIDLSLDEVIKRLTGRRSCNKCGAVYHVLFKPPKTSDICDSCGGELYQRSDDKEDVIKNRFEIYLKETHPLIEHYKKVGKVARVDGSKDVKNVFDQVFAAAKA